MVPRLLTKSAFVMPVTKASFEYSHHQDEADFARQAKGNTLTDTRVGDREGVVGLVRRNVDVELRIALQHRLVGEGLEADLVQRV